MKPDFICAGFVKCGTTTLYHILKQNSYIGVSNIKEPEFYRNNIIYYKGFQWYEKRYYSNIKCGSNILVGEVNPRLSGKKVERTAQRISKNFDENLKLIFIMRNPVQRSFSHYKYALLNGNMSYKTSKYDCKYGHTKTFYKKVKEAYKKNRLSKEEIFCSGKYYCCINNFMQHFKKENMKFIIFEEFIKDPEKISKEIYEFLNISVDNNIEYKVKSNESKEFNITSASKIKLFGVLHNLRNIFASLELYNKYPIINRKIDQLYYKIKTESRIKSNNKSCINEKTRILLENYYRKDKNKLKKLMDKDLDSLWFR